MKKKLGLTQVCEILLRQNLITKEQKDSILLKEESQKNKLTKLNAFKNNASELIYKDILPSDIIIDLKIPNQKTGEGYLTEETIMRAVADMLSIPFKKIDPLELDIEVVTRTVSKAFAIRNLAVPIEVKNNELKVAMVDPLDSEVLDDIKKATEQGMEANLQMGKNHLYLSDEVIANAATVSNIGADNLHTLVEAVKELSENPT